MNTAILYSKHEDITEKSFLTKTRTISQLLANGGSISFVCCDDNNDIKKILKTVAKNNDIIFATESTVINNSDLFSKILFEDNFGKYKKSVVSVLENEEKKFFDCVAHILCTILGNSENYAFDYIDICEKSYEETLKILSEECLFSNPRLYAINSETSVRVLILAESSLLSDAENLCNETLINLKMLFGDNAISNPFDDIAWTVVELLNKHNLKVATAESCTAGMLSSAITSVPGSSAVFEIGISSYADRIKKAALGVSSTTLKKYGAVSMQTAVEMARGIKLLSDADIGISATGVAGPASSEYKPVGTVYIALTDSKRNWVIDLNLDSKLSRDEIRRKTTYACLDLLRRYLECLPNELPDGTEIGAPLFLLYGQPHFDAPVAVVESKVENTALDIVNEILEEITTNSLDVFEEKIEPFEDKLSADEIGFTVNESLFDDVETTETYTPNFDIKPYIEKIKNSFLCALQKTKQILANIGKLKRFAVNTIFGLIIASILLTSISIYAYFDASNKNSKLIESLRESWSYTGAVDENGYLADITKFSSVNTDISAWLNVGVNNVNLPVCSNTSGGFYRNHNYKKDSSKYGALYFGSNIAPNGESYARNTVIYGNSPSDNSMFSSLKKYKSVNYLRQNTQIVLTTKYSQRIYQIFAVMIIDSGAADGFDHTLSEFLNKDTFNEWLDEIKIRNLYKLSEYPTDFDTITLITDANDFENAKLVVVGFSVDSFKDDYSNSISVNPNPYYPNAWYEAHNTDSPFNTKPHPDTPIENPDEPPLIIVPGDSSDTSSTTSDTTTSTTTSSSTTSSNTTTSSTPTTSTTPSNPDDTTTSSTTSTPSDTTSSSTSSDNSSSEENSSSSDTNSDTTSDSNNTGSDNTTTGDEN